MSDHNGTGGSAAPQRWGPRPRLRGGGSRPRRAGWRRALPTWRMLCLSATALLVAAVALLVTGYLVVDIPEPKSAAAAQSNVYRYADGSVIARTGDVNRESVPLEQVPEHVRRAVLAAEDRDFYSASAVDPKAMVRAGWNMLRGEGRQSGSTITQQYVKNYYLDQQQTVTRKAKELFIAVKLDREFSKDEILEGYLNTSYFGRNAYGVQAAAQEYYGKDVDALDTSEGAYLATLLNAPGAYDVRSGPAHRERALARWEYVLEGMVSEGWLDEEEKESTAFTEPGDTEPQSGLSGRRGYLVEAVDQYLVEEGLVEEGRLAGGGVRVTTTIDPRRQAELERAVTERLGGLIDAERPQDGTVHAGAASVETGNGRLVALYGGRDYTEQFISGATRRDYQAASTFKPFVYAAALEHEARDRSGDRIGPDTTYSGSSGREVVAPDGTGTGWSPENEQDTDYGTLPVSEAMDKSVNAVFAQMGVDVGPELVRETAVRLGLPEDTPGLEAASGSISLGVSTPSPLDLVQAYATLAAHGERHPLVMVTSLTVDGEEVELPDREPQRAISRESADATTELLRGVVAGGTGEAAGAVGRPAAGKTGTAEQDKAAWFAGYTPELATVIALVGQDPDGGGQVPMYGALGMERVSGGGVPAEIWAQYTAAALEGSEVREFDLRPGDLPSGGGDDGDEPSSSPSEDASDDASDGPTDGGSEAPATRPAVPGGTSGPGTGQPSGAPGGSEGPTGPTGPPGGTAPTTGPEPQQPDGGAPDAG
ncbi:transglycosylase domain-containing protein [Streptomyces bohaiensis]|uniref:transglycosylase domain-containing protein n=1 Tax=Streptomyces bohaiensis TaxID=1431344 RepID=UPI001FD7AFBF|nr:transglycosylase domain-containing protein [Streptomyces bohaiensis]